MPIYEYACKACGHELDALQKIADAHLVDCPECNEPRLKRMLSAPSFRLKGQGWYETDFKKDGDKKRNLADDGGKPAADKKSDDGGNKTAAKSDAKTTNDKKPSGDKKSSGGDKAA